MLCCVYSSFFTSPKSKKLPSGTKSEDDSKEKTVTEVVASPVKEVNRKRKKVMIESDGDDDNEDGKENDGSAVVDPAVKEIDDKDVKNMPVLDSAKEQSGSNMDDVEGSEKMEEVSEANQTENSMQSPADDHKPVHGIPLRRTGELLFAMVCILCIMYTRYVCIIF